VLRGLLPPESLNLQGASLSQFIIPDPFAEFPDSLYDDAGGFELPELRLCKQKFLHTLCLHEGF
jgi:hypothetical protein